jgi:hypothetical protein
VGDRGITSDVTGVELESSWFNPEIVTPPPIAPQRSDSFNSEAPAWTKHSSVASHVERRTIEAVTTPRQSRYRRLAVAVTFLASLSAAVYLLTSTHTGRQALFRLERTSHRVGLGRHQSPVLAQAFTPLGDAPFRLGLDAVVHRSSVSMPSMPYALIPAPVVPVEKLRLVSAPIRRLSSVPARGIVAAVGASDSNAKATNAEPAASPIVTAPPAN